MTQIELTRSVTENVQYAYSLTPWLLVAGFVGLLLWKITE